MITWATRKKDYEKETDWWIDSPENTTNLREHSIESEFCFVCNVQTTHYLLSG